MPIYEYQCTGCDHHFDLIQKMSDLPIKTCPKCAEDKAIRLVSAAGFQLKGTGWYATDFKTKSKESSSATSSSTKTDKSSSGEKSTSGSTTEPTTTGSKKSNEVDS